MSGWLPLAPLLAMAALYAAGVTRLRRRGDRWPAHRTACALGGLALVALAVLPPLATRDERFEVHAVQHMLLSSLAPLLLALCAPATVALRTLPAKPRGVLLACLHSRCVRLLSRPVPVLLLAAGASFVLYLTPLYARTEQSAVLHLTVHAHLLGAGCLLSWYLVSPDPMQRRPRVQARLSVLLVAAASHDVLAKLVYARASTLGPPDQVRAGAQLMFYAGDAVEVLLAAIVLAGWYARAERLRARRPRGVACSSPT